MQRRCCRLFSLLSCFFYLHWLLSNSGIHVKLCNWFVCHDSEFKSFMDTSCSTFPFCFVIFPNNHFPPLWNCIPRLNYQLYTNIIISCDLGASLLQGCNKSIASVVLIRRLLSISVGIWFESVWGIYLICSHCKLVVDCISAFIKTGKKLVHKLLHIPCFISIESGPINGRFFDNTNLQNMVHHAGTNLIFTQKYLISVSRRSIIL